MVDTYIIHLSKTIEGRTQRANPNVNYRFWLIIKCQSWLIDYKNKIHHTGRDCWWGRLWVWWVRRVKG